ncbi:MAG: helix-turn-helix domain-containing protein [Nitrososphaera sp.]|nr:helix-turn-helix domain-containing protein [Nitrososphaera sp.]
MGNQFGTLLRLYRERCEDTEWQKARLTQARLGELLGQKLGLREGYSHGAISEWERGKSQIHKDDRQVLVSLIKILHERGGLRTPTEANTFLLAGNYRPLNDEEFRQIFPGEKEEMPNPTPNFGANDQWRLMAMFLGELVFRPSERFRQVLVTVSEGPPPHWARALLASLASRYFFRGLLR